MQFVIYFDVILTSLKNRHSNRFSFKFWDNYNAIKIILCKIWCKFNEKLLFISLLIKNWSFEMFLVDLLSFFFCIFQRSVLDSMTKFLKRNSKINENVSNKWKLFNNKEKIWKLKLKASKHAKIKGKLQKYKKD